MTHLDPILLEALKAAMPPQRLSSAEREVLYRKIESLITTLHPDGYEAAELLAALTASVMSRYDNKLRCLDKLDEAHKKLQSAYEGIQDSEEGSFDVRDQYGQ